MAASMPVLRDQTIISNFGRQCASLSKHIPNNLSTDQVVNQPQYNFQLVVPRNLNKVFQSY